RRCLKYRGVERSHPTECTDKSLKQRRSHSVTDVSPPPPPVASVLPSGEKVSDSMRPVWPVSVRRIAPVWASHSLIVLSLQPLATVLPSGEKATESTSPR